MNRWPSSVTIHLWPYALRFANDIYNAAPLLKTGRTPSESFSSTSVRPQVLNYHPPFCPVYVLHSGLQGGGKRPNKWVRRSRIAVYLGSSPHHARSVALVLSLTTGHVSPQFQLKFDDFFETVQDVKSLPPSKWQLLSRFVTSAGRQSSTPSSPQGDKSSPSSAPPVPNHESLEFDFVDPGGTADEPQQVPKDPPPLLHREQPIPDVPPDPERHRHPEATRRSTRQTKPIRRLMENVFGVLDDTDAVEDYEIQTEAEDPIAFAASKSDPDTLNYKDAMGATDSMAFKEAMIAKANAHTDHDHWEVWAKADVPSDQDILPAVWAFRRKHRIVSREIYKYKARLNIHSGMQKHGVNYWETYSPVVNWFSIRLCLIMTLIFNWSTRRSILYLLFRKQTLSVTCTCNYIEG